MNRVTWLLVVSILGVPFGAWASAFLLASSGESITLECRSKGLYFGYQLDGLPACYEFDCTAIQARTDDGKWVQYAAHNGSNLGFVRNKNSTVRKNGAVAEALLERMLKASSIEFLNPGTGKPVVFSISDTDRAELESIAAECGTGAS
jgi:hypothetical protein